MYGTCTQLLAGKKVYYWKKYLISETHQVSNWYIPHSIIYSWVEFMVSWFLEDQETVQPCRCTPLVLSPDHTLSKQSGEPSQISWASAHFCDNVTIKTFCGQPAQKKGTDARMGINKFYCCKGVLRNNY